MSEEQKEGYVERKEVIFIYLKENAATIFYIYILYNHKALFDDKSSSCTYQCHGRFPVKKLKPAPKKKLLEAVQPPSPRLGKK